MKLVSKEVEEVVKSEMRKVIGVQCDICKKVVRPNYKYYEVTTGHHDWGFDSPESIEHKDICPECINSFVSVYLAGHHGTSYIDIETAYCRAEKVDADDWDVKYGEHYRIYEEGEKL